MLCTNESGTRSLKKNHRGHLLNLERRKNTNKFPDVENKFANEFIQP